MFVIFCYVAIRCVIIMEEQFASEYFFIYEEPTTCNPDDANKIYITNKLNFKLIKAAFIWLK